MAPESDHRRAPRTADSPGLRHGEAALRQCYIQRARYLISPRNDREFQAFASAVQETQKEWDRNHPEWRGGFQDGPLQRTGGGRGVRTMADRLLDMHGYAFRHGHHDAAELIRSKMDLWHHKGMELAQRFWPPEEFPNPGGNMAHPAWAFVDACLTYDPTRLDNYIESLFGDIKPMATFDAFLAIYFADVEPLRGTGLRYDGMSAAFQAEAGAQVERIRSMARPAKTTEERVDELRQEHGLSQGAVAVRLGLKRDAVKRISPGRASWRKDV